MSTTTTLELTKKRPGRPRKNITETKIKADGILSEPDFKDSIIELTILEPEFFKRLFGIIKNIYTTKIYILFDLKNIIFFTKNDDTETQLYCELDCNKCRYYRRETKLISVDLNDISDLIFNTLEKNDEKIIFRINEDDHLSKLYIFVYMIKPRSIKKYIIDQIPKDNDINYDYIKNNIVETNNLNYSLKFKLRTKPLKKTINAIIKKSKTIKINKHGNNPLFLNYCIDKKDIFTHHYTKNEEIELDSKINDDDIFERSMDIDNIKAFASNTLDNDIYFLLTKNEPTILYYKLDFATILLKIPQ